MQHVINAKTLRKELSSVLDRVEKGEELTLIYRSRPVCRLVPLVGGDQDLGPLDADPLYKADAVGCSDDGLSGADHDMLLYGDD